MDALQGAGWKAQVMSDPDLSIWFLALLASAIACIYIKGDGRKYARQGFLVLLTVFVSLTMSSAFTRHGNMARSEPALEADSAELFLRFGTAMDVLRDKVLGGLVLPEGTTSAAKKTADLGKLKQADFHEEAAKTLEKCLNKAPDMLVLEARLAVVLADSHQSDDRQKLARLLAKLSARQSGNESLLGKALSAIYLGHSLDLGKARQYETVLSNTFAPGWYRNEVLLQLYKVSHQQTLYQSLKLQIEDRASKLLLHMLLVTLIGAILIVIGLIVILVQLFTLPRSWGRPEEEGQGVEAAPWSLTTVYGVFVGWLATQIFISGLAQHVLKSTGALSKGPVVAGLATAALYLASNGPALLYIYWFACRPNHLRFFEAVRMRLKVGKLGPVRLVLIGFCAWCAALPIIAAVSYLAMKYWGAQGSSNPVLTLVLEAARSSDYRATIIFYITLGVLAPFCEESLFRGFLYRSLRRRLGVGTSLLASAALFAAVHLDSGAVVQLFCLGWIFGFIFERTRSLIPSMVAHGLWNSGTFTLVLLIFGS